MLHLPWVGHCLRNKSLSAHTELVPILLWYVHGMACDESEMTYRI